MNAADLARELIAMLETSAAREGSAALVSVTIDVVGAPCAGESAVETTRKTRTLLFMEAERRDGAGALVARASAVFKLAEAT